MDTKPCTDKQFVAALANRAKSHRPITKESQTRSARNLVQNLCAARRCLRPLKQQNEPKLEHRNAESNEPELPANATLQNEPKIPAGIPGPNEPSSGALPQPTLGMFYVIRSTYFPSPCTPIAPRGVYTLGTSVRLLLLCLTAGLLCAQTQTPILPLRDVKPGQIGIGRTVFTGDTVEDFRAEILGVLENVGPKQSIILARLSGGPIERTGVMQGMSGSPVYVDGKLIGAVAMAFPFAKEPIAGIRPIEEMLRPDLPVRRAQTNPATPAQLLAAQTNPSPIAAPGLPGKLQEIATPVSFSGFTAGTLKQFSRELEALGLSPVQGLSGNGRPGPMKTAPAPPAPGSMISVQLMTGDMSVAADGTVTMVDRDRVYAFGHRFLAVGETELPFARSSVIALLPNLNTSFKISAAREWLGVITRDHNAAVSGQLGRPAHLVPVSIAVKETGAAQPLRYRMSIVNDRSLSPFLLQMALYSALDTTERTLGAGSFRLNGEIQFQGATPPLRLNNMYTGDFNVPAQVSLGAVMPLMFALQSNFAELRLKEVKLELESFDAKKQMQIDQLWASRGSARPGETVELAASLIAADGSETVRKLSYTIPASAPPGTLYFTVADGPTINVSEYKQLSMTPYSGTAPRSPAQIISSLNEMRGNNKAYVRVWRASPTYQVQGEQIPDPPASLALLLGRAQTAVGSPTPIFNARLAEYEWTFGDMVVTGSKTAQVEVKE